jgi:transposase
VTFRLPLFPAIADECGVEMSLRGVQKLLVRLGLEYHHRAQGGFWAERR